jgi:hypothetical protein
MLGFQSTGANQMLAALESRALHAEQMSGRLDKASDLIYQETAHRFDTEGDGIWPQLSESTVAKKESQGYGEPAQPLYAEGNLYESATSPNGPYSDRLHTDSVGTQQVIMLVDWENDGWQIPTVLSEGTDDAGRSHDVRIPSRPIWPPAEQMREPVGKIILAGI